MTIQLIFKIAAVGLLVGFLNMVLTRAGRDEQALMMTIAGLIIVMLVLLTNRTAFHQHPADFCVLAHRIERHNHG